MSRRTRQQIEQERQQAIALAQSQFFGGITKEEAIEVFKVLAVLAQFPGATPPEPLQGCNVVWTSTLKVGDSLDKQVFDVQVDYKGRRFFYTSRQNRTIQLPDNTFMALESWDYQALRVVQQIKS